MDADRVLVGRIAKPHGIRGEVAVELLSDRLERFAPGALLHAAGRTLRVVASRPHQGRLLLTLEGITDRGAAERLRGAALEAERGEVPDSDTYLASELVGMAVLDEDGRALGVVDALIELPVAAGYDLLEVRRADGSTWLLPAVDAYVEVEQDRGGSERLVLTSPPQGLVAEPGRDDASTPDR